VNRSGWRSVALLVASALVALAGCSSGTDQSGHASDTVADLLARAAIAPCPVPSPAPTSTTTPPLPPATTSPAGGGVTASGPTGSSSAGPSASGSARPGYQVPVLSGDANPSVAEGQLLPEGAFGCLAGGPDVPLRRITGVPMVVNLWATWCLPCRTELPAFERAYANADPARLRILGVATQDPGLSRQLSFAIDTGLHLPNLVDDQGRVAAGLGIRGLPATLFVDAAGTVVHVYNGPPLTFEALRDLIRSHLRVTIRG
jgi:Thiol-disulfide isomerase and thioredoxins